MNIDDFLEIIPDVETIEKLYLFSFREALQLAAYFGYHTVINERNGCYVERYGNKWFWYDKTDNTKVEVFDAGSAQAAFNNWTLYRGKT